MKDNRVSVRYMATTAIFSALAFVLMLLEFGLPFIPFFLKFDFSDLPALIASFAMGPLYGVAVTLVKNLLHIPFGSSAGVGELANFLLSATFVAAAGTIYRIRKTRKTALIGSLAGAVLSAAVSFPVNRFVTYPFYAAAYMPTEAIVDVYHAIFPGIDTLDQALLYVNVPFTFVKGTLVAILTFVVYKKISPVIKGTKEK